MPTDDIAEKKPCPHGHHRGIGCAPCTLADFEKPGPPGTTTMRVLVSTLLLPRVVAERDDARADLAKLRAAVEGVRVAHKWCAECGPESLDQAKRDLGDAMGVMFGLLPEGDETWLLAPPSGPPETRSTPRTAIAAGKPYP